MIFARENAKIIATEQNIMKPGRSPCQHQPVFSGKLWHKTNLSRSPYTAARHHSPEPEQKGDKKPTGVNKTCARMWPTRVCDEFSIFLLFIHAHTARIIHVTQAVFFFFLFRLLRLLRNLGSRALNNIAIEAASVTVRGVCMHVSVCRPSLMIKEAGRSSCYPVVSGCVFYFSRERRFSFPQTQHFIKS